MLVVEAGQCAESVFLRLPVSGVPYFSEGSVYAHQSILHLDLLVLTRQPLVSQLGSAVQVDGRDDLHIGCRQSATHRWDSLTTLTLPPLSSTPGHLALDQLEDLQLQHWVVDAEHALHNLLASSADTGMILKHKQ